MPLKTIAANNVNTIKCFQLHPQARKGAYGKSRPAFKVEFNDNSLLVLKAELKNNTLGNQAEKSALFGAALMQKVSPTIGAEKLTASEMAVLLALPATKFQADTVALATVTKDYIADLHSSNMFFFMKMPFVDNLRDADHYTANAAKAQKLLTKLKGDRQAVIGLGKIIAVDLFIGNGDRFNSQGNIINKGNILFEKNPSTKKLTPVGLDFFEAQGPGSNLYKDPPPMWGGLRLQSHHSLKIFADTVIASLNAMFTSTIGNNLPPAQLLGFLETGQLMLGMTEAINEMRQHLPQVSRLPAGVRKRMDLLDW
jgi:Actin-fragmin kinase, catalytic